MAWVHLQLQCIHLRRYFQMHFLEGKFEFRITFHWHDTRSLGSDWQHAITDSDNGLVPNRWQAILWTNDGLVHCWGIYVSLIEWIDAVSDDYITGLWQCHYANLWKYSFMSMYFTKSSLLDMARHRIYFARMIPTETDGRYVSGLIM